MGKGYDISLRMRQMRRKSRNSQVSHFPAWFRTRCLPNLTRRDSTLR